MSVVAERPATVDEVLAAVTGLAPAIAARAGEVEAARRIPADLLDDLKAAGVFRLLLPPSHGGIGADAMSALEVLEVLAAADGSVGWTALIGAAAWIDLARLPRSTFDELYDGSDVVTAGSFRPSGSVTPDAAGYRVRGRWSFVSGCEHADVLFGNGMTSGDRGEPPLRITVFRPRDVVIEDTWDVSGLRGTGSHHIRVDELVVPAERTLDPLSGAPCIDAVITHIHPPPLLACAVASIALGIARGALDDALSLAEGKVPMLDHAPVATNPTFHVELASADAAVRAAHALVHDAIATLWATAGAGDEPTLVDRARMRAAAVWATERAVAAVDSAYRSGGGDAVFASSPLQRRLRDVHAVTQHFLVRPDTMATAGAILAGNDVDVLVF